MSNSRALRGQILHFLDDPAMHGEAAWQSLDDGILWIENGYIRTVGDAAGLLAQLPADLPLQHFPHHLIIPGFIDTHIHYPQTEMIAAYGKQLLSWLQTYTFPTEMQFGDPEYASQIARIFLKELLRNGTTTALVFATVHPESVDAFFNEAQALGLRMIAGKVMMDRNAPPELCDTAASSLSQSRDLIRRWHGVDRLQYAVTPRFAPTSSEQQLLSAGALLKEFDDLYLHTHLSENRDEMAWVATLFPEAKNYLDVYDRAGLLSRRSVFAHGIHLSAGECQRLGESGAAVAHCPTSNLFLGSGLINLEQLRAHGVHIGLGTDVGGGTSFSMLKTMDEAYKIQQLRGATLEPFQALYHATLGGARALDLEGTVGNFLPGNEADCIVLDLHATPLLQFRSQYCPTLKERLFMLNTLGDDRVIECSYAMGCCVHHRDGETR
ncbi:guanine deaminase [Zhongshania sp.]|uniref:guanine deaminase n=1 Tax=Zhongshania sp. TaxID=1971902 RepID=UPI003568ED09